eukprot:3420791-Rhodomonas_salina.1
MFPLTLAPGIDVPHQHYPAVLGVCVSVCVLRGWCPSPRHSQDCVREQGNLSPLPKPAPLLALAPCTRLPGTTG